MKKENQSLIDFLGTMPAASFLVTRSPISNKEAQALYDIWSNGQVDEYGKFIVPNNIDNFQITSLTSKGYLNNTPNRFAATTAYQSSCEFTAKAKDVIQKIILYKEKSSLDKSSKKIDYETLLANSKNIIKTASRYQSSNWLERTIQCK